VKIIGTGVNNGSHVREAGREPPAEPLLFLKPWTALVRPGAPIVLPP
jgi:2-keto-4-pentenoate hydratase/2-oxohepta-3-ene-1,7-dioic acid hydratase in catechol pathway